jgi:hypothetical protein
MGRVYIVPMENPEGASVLCLSHLPNVRELLQQKSPNLLDVSVNLNERLISIPHNADSLLHGRFSVLTIYRGLKLSTLSVGWFTDIRTGEGD